MNKLLVVGEGSMGRRHVASALASGWDAETWDITHGRPLARALSLAPDAVAVATPASTHAAVALQLADSGYAGPLFVEKPLALSEEDADVFSSWPHAVTAVGCNWRFHPIVVKCLAGWRDAGGSPFSRAVAWVHCDMRTWPGRGYADSLLECGSHEIDLLRYATGCDLRVSYAERQGPGWVIMLVGDGCEAHVSIDGASPVFSRGLRLLTRDGFCGGYTVQNPVFSEAERACLSESYRAELAEFLSRVQSGGPAAISATFDDGLAVLRALDTAQALAVESA